MGVCFWYTILNNKDEFCAWLRNVEINIETWRAYKSMLYQSRFLTIFEKAQVFFFLNRTNVSGVIKGGVIGGISQEGNYKINARFNKTDLIDRIEKNLSTKAEY